MSGYHIAAITGKNIYSGDLIKVNEKSSCFIRFIDDKTHVQIGPNSIVKINENNLSKDIKIIKGNIYIKNLYVKDKTSHTDFHCHGYRDSYRAYVPEYFSGQPRWYYLPDHYFSGRYFCPSS